ncbi:MAG: hypothetical protein ACFFB5_24815 [Promethearchaeota archaeon]
MVRIALLLATMLYLIAYTLTNFVGTPEQYALCEYVEFRETYCEYIDDSWVVTFELYLPRHLDYSLNRLRIMRIYAYDGDIQIPVYDVTVVDYMGNIYLHTLSDNNYITLERARKLKESNEYGAIQFKIPKQAIVENNVQLLIHTAGGMDHYKEIQLTKNPIDLTTLADKISDTHFFDLKTEYIGEWMPPYFLICSWLGVFLDYIDIYFTQRQTLAHSMLLESQVHKRKFIDNE